MKFKLDENVPPIVKELLDSLDDVEVEDVHDELLSGATDHTLARICKAEDRILITLDMDFSKPLLHPIKTLHGVVIIHLYFPSLRKNEAVFKKFLKNYKLGNLPGNVLIIEEDKIILREEKE